MTGETVIALGNAYGIVLHDNSPGIKGDANIAIATVDPMKAVGKPHRLWIGYASIYERSGNLKYARQILATLDGRTVSVVTQEIAEGAKKAPDANDLFGGGARATGDIQKLARGRAPSAPSVSTAEVESVAQNGYAHDPCPASFA